MAHAVVYQLFQIGGVGWFYAFNAFVWFVFLFGSKKTHLVEGPDMPMFFLNSTGAEEISASGTSYLNRTEAFLSLEGFEQVFCIVLFWLRFEIFLRIWDYVWHLVYFGGYWNHFSFVGYMTHNSTQLTLAFADEQLVADLFLVAAQENGDRFKTAHSLWDLVSHAPMSLGGDQHREVGDLLFEVRGETLPGNAVHMVESQGYFQRSG